MQFSTLVPRFLVYFLWIPEYVQADRCDFEGNSFCGWQHEGWERTKYRSTLTSSGPQELAKEGEYYIRTILTDSLRQAVLHVPVTSSHSCINFWYYMYGVHITNLTVSTNHSTLWTEAGDQGKMWHCGAATVPPSVGEVRFIVHKGSSHFDIVALDHIQSNRDNPCHNSGCNRTGITTIPPTVSPSTESSLSSVVSTGKPTTAPSSWLSDNLHIVIAVPSAVLAVCIVVVVVFVCFHRKKEKPPHDLSGLENPQFRNASDSSERYRPHPFVGTASTASVYDEITEEYDEIPADYVSPIDDGDRSKDGEYLEPIDVGKSANDAVHENGGVSVDLQSQNVGFNPCQKRVSVVDDDGYITARNVNSDQYEHF